MANFPPVLALMLLGHVLGDFYFQSNSMAERKRTSWAALGRHGLVYLLCTAAVLLAGVTDLTGACVLALLSAAVHLAVDFMKNILLRTKTKAEPVRWIRRHSFVADQLLHLATLLALYFLYGHAFTGRAFLQTPLATLPAMPLIMLLGVLAVLRPVSLLIESGEVWSFGGKSGSPDEERQNAGKMIGYLERLIVFFFLLFGQYGAIAFVLTAKSIARFKEIENDKAMAEYYLIGTLISNASVFITAMLLGLLR